MHQDVRKTVKSYGLENPSFRPTFGHVFAQLRRDPKSFPKKLGPLAAARAATLRFRGVAWRLVFTLDEPRRVVSIVSLAPHDRAYAEAERRLR